MLRDRAAVAGDATGAQYDAAAGGADDASAAMQIHRRGIGDAGGNSAKIRDVTSRVVDLHAAERTADHRIGDRCRTVLDTAARAKNHTEASSPISNYRTKIDDRALTDSNAAAS